MKRWIIRSFFIGLLLLCVGGWRWSYFFCESLAYQQPRTLNPAENKYVEVSGGNLLLMTYVPFSDDATPWPVGWTYYHRHRDRDDVNWEKRFDSWEGPRFLGFHFFYKASPRPAIGNADRGIQVPFWFPTTISAALLWLVWRKTRSKAKGRAFPVEANQGGEAKP